VNGKTRCLLPLGGVLTLSSYRRDFRFDDRTAASVSSLAIGLQQFGGFTACFAIWPITRKFGRKPAIAIGSLIFVIGAMVQTLNTHSTSIFFAGRFIAGVGLGGVSVVVPMFSAEMTPKQMRGQIGSFYQLMFTIGIFTSYWIDWVVAKDVPDTQSRQWQIPVGLQMLFASLLGLGTMTLKESTRWLTMQGRHAEAWESLTWIRASDDEDVQLEMEEIKLGVEAEARAKEGFKFRGIIIIRLLYIWLS
jgi:MFS family permease